ncbi:MAG TPA: ATP-binding cassette domain-containing protein, partial [Methanomassiliicoccales archaeon]|nr:ATP-binding cassette domain-containing protein [Methanomassiliicoccales archaeon]
MSKDTIIDIKDLRINFYTKAGVVKAIDGVDLSIIKGETFGLVGESGCGKSVTANSIMGLIQSPPGKIEKGAIWFNAPKEILERMQPNGRFRKGSSKTISLTDGKVEILGLNKKNLRLIRGRAISMIFQEPMTALNPVFTAGDQISEIILLHEKRELAEAVLKKLNETNGQKKRYRRASKKIG